MANRHGRGRLRAYEDPICPSQSFTLVPKITVTHIHRRSTEQRGLDPSNLYDSDYLMLTKLVTVYHVCPIVIRLAAGFRFGG